MPDLTEYDGKSLALLLCGQTDEGKDDWAVFPGVARIKDDGLWLERPEGEGAIEIRSEWYERIQPTDLETKDILQNAEYVIALSVGNVEEAHGGLLPTGLKWPD